MLPVFLIRTIVAESFLFSYFSFSFGVSTFTSKRKFSVGRKMAHSVLSEYQTRPDLWLPSVRTFFVLITFLFEGILASRSHTVLFMNRKSFLLVVLFLVCNEIQSPSCPFVGHVLIFKLVIPPL